MKIQRKAKHLRVGHSVYIDQINDNNEMVRRVFSVTKHKMVQSDEGLTKYLLRFDTLPLDAFDQKWVVGSFYEDDYFETLV